MSKTAADLVREAESRIETVRPEQIADDVRSGEVLVVDVRDPDEWQKGHIPEAMHASRGMLEFKADPNTPYYDDRLGTDKRLVVHCTKGLRGALAAATLKDMGYEKVANLEGGFDAWKEAGLPVDE